MKRKDNNQTIWKAGTLNEFGQWKDYTLGNNLLKTQKSYDAYGQLNTIKTQNISTSNYVQDLEYSFNTITGNLTWRKDHRYKVAGVSLTENFNYDALNRLIFNTVNGNGPFDIIYDDAKAGNISNRDPIGAYNYAGSRPHAITSLDKYPNANIPSGNQDITYNSFNKVQTITEGNKRYEFVYGPMEDRKRVDVYENDYKQKSIYYHDGYELNGNTTNIYIPGGDGLAAIYFDDDDGRYGLFYILKDHLGSVASIINSSGEINNYEGRLQEYSFDAWGRRRNPIDWSYDNVTTTCMMITRGFTGHEHLDDLGLINMNGRVYDPYIGLFLSPDNYVQFPDFTQNYNRYAYCLNNPLIYTDPSGEFPVAFAIGFVIGAYLGGSAANGWDFTPWDGGNGSWDFKSSDTWAGMIFGGLLGGFGAQMGWFALTTNYSFNLSVGAGLGNAFTASANFLVGNSGVILQGVGYVTAAGGGAYLAYNYVNKSWGGNQSIEQQVNQSINIGLNNYYESERNFAEFKSDYWKTRTSIYTGELRQGDLSNWFLGEYAMTGNEEYYNEFINESDFNIRGHFGSIDERLVNIYPEAYILGGFKLTNAPYRGGFHFSSLGYHYIGKTTAKASGEVAGYYLHLNIVNRHLIINKNILRHLKYFKHLK